MNPPLLIGAHISVGGPMVARALNDAKRSGMTAAQIFPGSPQRYVIKAVSDEEAAICRKITAEFPLFLHVAYTANPATSSPGLQKAIADYYLKCDDLAHRLGARGIITHSGSYGEGSNREDGIRRVRCLLDSIHPEIKTRLILENVAGLGTSLGRRPEDMVSMVEGFERVSVVWDTAHAYAQGIDISVAANIRHIRVVLGKKLTCLHFNGVPDEITLGCHRDRHQLMVRCPRLSAPALLNEWFRPISGLENHQVPLILENPDGAPVLEDVAFLQAAYLRFHSENTELASSPTV